MARIKKVEVGGQKWAGLFYDFLGELTVETKDFGKLRLADNLLGSQKIFIDDVCGGLDEGVHHFCVLKARQLGISTISLALVDLFWPMVHDGMQGAIITDTEDNKNKFRIIIDQLIDGLPSSMKVGIKTNNRSNLVFKNGSVIDYMVAGRKKNSGLGRSRALNMVHATECSSWGDPEGVSSLMSALSEKHEDRLNVFESTAMGFNLFWEMWKSAEGDPETQRTIFLGWWSKQSYSVKRGSRIWQKYWDGKYDDQEAEFIAKVKRLYGFDVKAEQVVWRRWKEQTQLTAENMMAQEFPWTAEQAFVATGKGFFNRRNITKSIQEAYNNPTNEYAAYRYHLGDDFLATEIEDLQKSVDRGEHVTMKDMDLKIWHPPIENGAYVIGVDPAYGRSDQKDRHCIEVWRCYADKLVQCAEYCTDNYESKHVAWVMAHLAGMYKNCMINLEVSGPGGIVMNELDHLRQLVTAGYLNKRASEAGIVDIFNYVRWYLYHRPDSMGAGYVYNWKTNADNKYGIMNQFRDCYSTNYLTINSVDLLEEMQTIVQDGPSIEASGTNKDDRVIASALAIEAWVKWIRPGMITNGKTYAIVSEEETSEASPIQNMIAGIITDTFERKSLARQKEQYNQQWE